MKATSMRMGLLSARAKSCNVELYFKLQSNFRNRLFCEDEGHKQIPGMKWAVGMAVSSHRLTIIVREMFRNDFGSTGLELLPRHTDTHTMAHPEHWIGSAPRGWDEWMSSRRVVVTRAKREFDRHPACETWTEGNEINVSTWLSLLWKLRLHPARKCVLSKTTCMHNTSPVGASFWRVGKSNLRNSCAYFVDISTV